MGFLRGFVGLACVIFCHVFWPRASDLSFSTIYLRHFLRFLAWLYFGAGSLGSPPISVRSSEASESSFSWISVRRGWACPIFWRPTFFPLTMMILQIFFIFPMPCVHASPCPPRHATPMRCASYKNTLSFTEDNVSALVAFGVWSSGFG